MKQAQNVAQAVARSRPSLSSWSCMGARRRAVGTFAGPKQETSLEPHAVSRRSSESILIDHGNGETLVDELRFSGSMGSDLGEIEEEELIQADQATNVSAAEEMTEGELWFDLEKELDRQDEAANAQAQEEEAAAVKEITEEANAMLKTVDDKQPMSSDALERHQFYPPGRIMHMLALPALDAEPVAVIPDECNVGIYETPRELYSKIRLSRTMINDHYMPMYKKTMELLIDKLAKEDDDCTDPQL